MKAGRVLVVSASVCDRRVKGDRVLVVSASVCDRRVKRDRVLVVSASGCDRVVNGVRKVSGFVGAAGRCWYMWFL